MRIKGKRIRKGTDSTRRRERTRTLISKTRWWKKQKVNDR